MNSQIFSLDAKWMFFVKVGAERFDKEYAYGVRHNYGKEGKRTVRHHFTTQKIMHLLTLSFCC